MARLHEYQSKALLAQHGVAVPEGGPASSAAEAAQLAARLGGPVAVKAQAWVTNRAATGGVQFAQNPRQAEARASEILQMRFGNFAVSEVLVERMLDIHHELFVSVTIDDAAQAPVVLLDLHGGSGIESRAESAREGGYDPGPVIAMTRALPEGGELSWRLCLRRPAAGDGLVPFLIQWAPGPHPSASSPGGCTLTGLTAEHPRPDDVSRMTSAIGVELPLAEAARPALVATIESPHGMVVLT